MFSTALDTIGIALAAIQGLRGVVDEKDARIEEMEKGLIRLERSIA